MKSFSPEFEPEWCGEESTGPGFSQTNSVALDKSHILSQTVPSSAFFSFLTCPFFCCLYSLVMAYLL